MFNLLCISYFQRANIPLDKGIWVKTFCGFCGIKKEKKILKVWLENAKILKIQAVIKY